MGSYKFVYQYNGVSAENYKVEVESNAETLSDILVNFKQFLQAAGFTIDGEIEVVENE